MTVHLVTCDLLALWRKSLIILGAGGGNRTFVLIVVHSGGRWHQALFLKSPCSAKEIR